MSKWKYALLATALALSACGGGGVAPNAGPQTSESAALDAAHFVNPIVAAAPSTGSADPSVVLHGGFYYYCRSLADGSIGVAKARRLQDIGSVPMQTVWTPPAGAAYSRELWAPELQYLQGRWYIYFAADDGDNAHHRMYALEGTTEDPQGAYEFKGKVAAPEDSWAIDGSVLQYGGLLYFVWSGWRGSSDGFPQVLYIAPMSDPWTISGSRHEIAAPDRSWEEVGAPLMEGPEALYHGDRIFVAYSTSGSWTDDYKLGLLTFSGGDILDARSWSKSSQAVFAKRPEAGVWGPGHNSFVKSPDGTQDWIVYHAIDQAGGGWSHRNVRAQPFTWTADGLPDFGVPLPVGVPVLQPSGT
jgi:GH43 family beta-xylosidase